MLRKFFEGRATVRVTGCDFLLLNRLRMFCISDICFDEIDKQLQFIVPLRFMSQVKVVLARQKYSVCVNTNFFGVLNVFYTRIILSIAAVLCIAAFFILNGFIFNVNVIGVEGEQAKEVAAFVHAHGARRFVHKSSSRINAVAGEIIGNFDFVAHASSKIVGNTLIFNVYSVGVTDKKFEGDIVAAMDGIVTNVIIASGRAMISVGDVVRAGQVLIKGERQVGAIDVGRDEFGKLMQEGIYVKARAVGEILADVKYSEFGINITVDELLAKIIMRTGIQKFDKVENFAPAQGVLEVVATVNMSIV